MVEQGGKIIVGGCKEKLTSRKTTGYIFGDSGALRDNASTLGPVNLAVIARFLNPAKCFCTKVFHLSVRIIVYFKINFAVCRYRQLDRLIRRFLPECFSLFPEKALPCAIGCMRMHPWLAYRLIDAGLLVS